ncbi:hypothetical protein TrLO_g7198 [Triparma laevis f. longispina]|uniref:Uncharacterized protein n=1 Tax=Triparma laevis f. longispina TaxID=1714387 RepID=A0A9W7EGD3_9STRA|nr:hypothetical protein TrLO_g7198 [Triparma laevis f. longispina]
MAQLGFLVFSSIQCEGKLEKANYIEEIWRELSGRKIVTSNLNLEEKVQCRGLSITTSCALYMLGGYGSEGDFGGTAECYAMIIVGAFGAGCLAAAGLWKMVVIRGEMI